MPKFFGKKINSTKDETSSVEFPISLSRLAKELRILGLVELCALALRKIDKIVLKAFSLLP